MIRLGIPQIGGPEWRGGFNYMVTLCDALGTHGAGRIQPVVFVRPDIAPADAARLARVEVVAASRVVPQRTIARTRALLTGRDRTAAQAFDAARIDVVFENAAFYGWRLRHPVVAWWPDFQHRRLPQLFDGAAWWRRELGFRAQLAGGRAVLVSSHDAATDLKRFYPVGSRPVGIGQFAVAPATLQDRADAADIAQRLGLPERFLFLPNQFWRHKNHALLVDALAILAARGTAATVAVVGHGDDPRAPGHHAALVARVAEAGLADRFRLLGARPYADVRALMIAAHALINPSRFEGWSTTVEEAKAFGTPLIVSDIAVHREQVDGDAWWFGCDDAPALADAMTAALAAPRAAHTPAIDDAARARVHAFASAVERLVIAVAAAGRGGARA